MNPTKAPSGVAVWQPMQLSDAPLVVYKLVGPSQFAAHKIWDAPQGHGLGFGDVNGDGRGDFVFRNGWLEAPADPYSGQWTLHPEFELGSSSVPILVVVKKPGQAVTKEELLKFYEGKIAKWWMPEDVVFVPELPHTATGKLSKLTLRQQMKDYKLESHNGSLKEKSA